jgi:hypothetical protein
MKDAFGFTDFQEITLSYIGEDNFLLISSKPLKDLDDIPLYHSRAIKFGYTNNYLIRLSAENINKPYLVIPYCNLYFSYFTVINKLITQTIFHKIMFQNIFGAFEGFVRFYDFKFLTVCCDNGSKTTFKIASTELPFKTTSIGLGWNIFCRNNGFQPGDVLDFKFRVPNQFNVVHVFNVVLPTSV